MANVRTRGTDKVKVVSAVITLAVIVALVFGIFSVAQNVKKSKNNNLVNLNETEGNVAIKTDDDPDIPVEEPTVGDDDIINANARASMSDDGDGTEDEVTEQTKEPETEEQEGGDGEGGEAEPDKAEDGEANQPEPSPAQ